MELPSTFQVGDVSAQTWTDCSGERKNKIVKPNSPRSRIGGDVGAGTAIVELKNDLVGVNATGTSISRSDGGRSPEPSRSGVGA